MTGGKKSKKEKIIHKIKDKEVVEEILEEETNQIWEKIVVVIENIIITIEIDQMEIEEDVEVEEEVEVEVWVEEIEIIIYRKPIGFNREKSLKLYFIFFFSE